MGVGDDEKKIRTRNYEFNESSFSACQTADAGKSAGE